MLGVHIILGHASKLVFMTKFMVGIGHEYIKSLLSDFHYDVRLKSNDVTLEFLIIVFNNLHLSLGTYLLSSINKLGCNVYA